MRLQKQWMIRDCDLLCINKILLNGIHPCPHYIHIQILPLIVCCRNKKISRFTLFFMLKQNCFHHRCKQQVYISASDGIRPFLLVNYIISRWLVIALRTLTCAATNPLNEAPNKNGPPSAHGCKKHGLIVP